MSILLLEPPSPLSRSSASSSSSPPPPLSRGRARARHRRRAPAGAGRRGDERASRDDAPGVAGADAGASLRHEGGVARAEHGGHRGSSRGTTERCRSRARRGDVSDGCDSRVREAHRRSVDNVSLFRFSAVFDSRLDPERTPNSCRTEKRGDRRALQVFFRETPKAEPRKKQIEAGVPFGMNAHRVHAIAQAETLGHPRAFPSRVPVFLRPPISLRSLPPLGRAGR